MNTAQILESAKSLDGLSHSEWIKLRNAVDESFRRKRRELDSEIKLSCQDDLKPTIHSRFGYE